MSKQPRSEGHAVRREARGARCGVMRAVSSRARCDTHSSSSSSYYYYYYNNNYYYYYYH